LAAQLITGERATDRIDAARAWLGERRPDEPLVVLAASSLAGQQLIHEATVERGAVFGWRHDTLARYAVRLATPRLAAESLAPAGNLVVEALCAARVEDLRQEEALGRFAPVADAPGLPRALARSLMELRAQGVSPDALEAEHPELASLLRALSTALEEAALADRPAILGIAAEQARATAGAPLLLLDVRVDSVREAELVGALAGASTEVLATAIAGDDATVRRLEEALGVKAVAARSEPSTSLGRLQRHLFAKAPAQAELDQDVEIMSAPGESRECVEIARRVLAEAGRGVAFDRMAVLLRAPDRYRAHLEEAMRRAGVPVYLARGTVKPDPTGRALVALIACAAEGLSARRFAEYLSLGQLPDTKQGAPPAALPDTERWVPPEDELIHLTAEAPESVPEVDHAHTLVTPRRWERLLVEAAVIGGLDRWKRRLDGLAGELHAELSALEDADGVYADRILRQIQDLSTLRAFALPLLEELAALPDRATWGEWIDKLGALASRAIAQPTRVLSVLAELMPMAEIGPIEISQVRLVLERRLGHVVAPPTARRHGRVLIAPCEAARGMSFDVVFVPGLAERLFPQKLIEDPVLRDSTRRATSPWLVTEEERLESERLQLRVAVGAAARRLVLSYPRLDVDQARPRVPSFYGLEVLHAATGALPGFDELGRLADRGGAARIGWPAPADPMDAIDAAEHDLALLQELLERPAEQTTGLARYLLDVNPHLGRALRFRARRWIRKWTPADGLVEPAGLARTTLDTQLLDSRSYSCTALQHFARCPYKFYLYAVMRLSPREEARAIEELDPLQRGSLVHDIQFELLEALRDADALPITYANLEAASERLDEVLERVSERYRDQLAPAIERVWLDSVASVRADLREWLRRLADEPTWLPWRFELAFGLRSRRGRDPASQADAVPLDCGIQLRGAIDLVERSRAGDVRATDHKTGKVRAEEGAMVGGGETLQPILYALALEKLLPDQRVVEGRLFYCTETGRFEERIFPLDDDARRAATQVASTIDDALKKGFLPAAPAERACRFCDYLAVCGPYEELRANNVKGQQPLVPLKRLRGKR
jgi:CRISPR/Cas system-associated exonuclease Cas4 (RecB family)